MELEIVGLKVEIEYLNSKLDACKDTNAALQKRIALLESEKRLLVHALERYTRGGTPASILADALLSQDTEAAKGFICELSHALRSKAVDASRMTALGVALGCEA